MLDLIWMFQVQYLNFCTHYYTDRGGLTLDQLPSTQGFSNWLQVTELTCLFGGSPKSYRMWGQLEGWRQTEATTMLPRYASSLFSLKGWSYTDHRGGMGNYWTFWLETWRFNSCQCWNCYLVQTIIATFEFLGLPEMGATKEDHGRQLVGFSDIPWRCCSGCPGANPLPVPQPIQGFEMSYGQYVYIFFTALLQMEWHQLAKRAGFS